MSSANGICDDRHFLDAFSLTKNPFVMRAQPPEALIDRLWVGRGPEIRAAAVHVADPRRNLLVWGGRGCGKTTFVRKLLRELRMVRKTLFLTGYVALVEDTPHGFQRAALTALCEGARALSSSEALLSFASETLAAVDQLSPDALDLHFRRAIELAKAAGFHRVVLAIDEIDKREAQVVQGMLGRSRFALDASFVLAARRITVRSPLFHLFGRRIQLRPFTDAESREIVRKNLAGARWTPEPEETLRPFEDDAVEQMISLARGLPRPLNLMASATLEVALDDAIEAGGGVASVTAEHLVRALEREGEVIYNEVGAEHRLILGRIFQQRGYADASDLEALAPGKGPRTVHDLDELAEQDAVLSFEGGDGAGFALSPSVEQFLRAV